MVDGDLLRAVAVTTGLTDGEFTEMLQGEPEARATTW